MPALKGWICLWLPAIVLWISEIGTPYRALDISVSVYCAEIYSILCRIYLLLQGFPKATPIKWRNRSLRTDRQFPCFWCTSNVACETIVTTGSIWCLKETVKIRSPPIDGRRLPVRSSAEAGLPRANTGLKLAHAVFFQLFIEHVCRHNQCVDKKHKDDQGAGDQGLMFASATNEPEDYMQWRLTGTSSCW